MVCGPWGTIEGGPSGASFFNENIAFCGDVHCFGCNDVCWSFYAVNVS